MIDNSNPPALDSDFFQGCPFVFLIFWLFGFFSLVFYFFVCFFAIQFLMKMREKFPLISVG